MANSAFTGVGTDLSNKLNVANPTFTGLMTGGTHLIAAGSTSVPPIDFTPSGASLKTSPVAGDMEVDSDGVLYYTHNTSERGVIPSYQWLRQAADRTLTSTTAQQKIFNTVTNGALTVKGSTRYRFTCICKLSGMSATSGNLAFSILGGGTATLTAAFWRAAGLDNTTPTTGAAIGGSITEAATSSGNIVTAGTGTGMWFEVSGTIDVNAGGTIIPSVGLTTAAAATLEAGSFFEIWTMGANSTNSVGNWS